LPPNGKRKRFFDPYPEQLILALTRKDYIKFSLFSFLLLALVVAWLGFGEHGFVHLYRMEKERQVYQERISQLQRENQELLEEINRLRTDKDYIESMGRRELGLIRNDEILFRFDKKKESPPPAEIDKENSP
jgi:cell division protein FtsB